MKKLFLLLLIIPIFAGCRVTGVGIHAHVGTPAPHYDPYQYYYYPDAEVYFDISRNVYFYFYGGRWIMSARLPRHIHIEIDDRVTLELDTDRPYSHHPRHLREYPRGNWKKHYRNGPPDHAPAHGYRSRDRGYYYYPDANVYYDPRNNVYYYPSGKRWVRTNRLPRNYRLNRDDYVDIDDDSDRPYERHQRHSKQFPRGDWKKNYKQLMEQRGESRKQQQENTSRQQERKKSRRNPDDKQEKDDDSQQDDNTKDSTIDRTKDIKRRGNWKSDNY